MLQIITFLCSSILALFFGYWIHRALHCKWSGRFYVAHMEHHLKQYPANNLTSKIYRKAKWNHRGPFLFTPPLLLIACVIFCLSALFHVPFLFPMSMFCSFIIMGIIEDIVHDWTHVRGSRFRQSFFRRIRSDHYVHHIDMTKNFGISSTIFDKLFGTYSKRN